MKRLRSRFGRGPVELVLPGLRILVILDPEDVGRVLAQAPYPFHPANIEKTEALEQFQPHGRWHCWQATPRSGPAHWRTPTILRDTTEDTEWREGSERFTVAAGAGLMIVVPAFHRDDDQLPFAHRFIPDIWLDGRAQQYPQLVPSSAGPGECPGKDLVLFVTSTVLAHLVSALDVRLTSTPRLDPDKPLPMTYNQLTLDFAVSPLHSAMSSS